MISYVRNVGKTVLAAVVSLVFIVGAAGCGNTQKDDGPDYADDEAMSIIAKRIRSVRMFSTSTSRRKIPIPSSMSKMLFRLKSITMSL